MKVPIKADNLQLLADVLDKWDAERGETEGDEVQQDLRRTASAVALLEGMPRIVCLIGSTRYADTFTETNLKFTKAGKIVLSIGAVTSDAELGLDLDHDLKHKLDVLHLWKIVLADEVYCINVNGYIGASTARELGFARLIGKKITFHEPVPPGTALRVNYDVPIEMVEYALEARAAAVGEDLDRVRSRAVEATVSPVTYCFVDGCSEQAAVMDRKPVLALNPTWVSDTRGGVTRWFCSAKHLTRYNKARRLGKENAYEGGAVGNTKPRDEESRQQMRDVLRARKERLAREKEEGHAEEGSLRDSEVEA